MSVEGETASARQQQHHPGDHDFDPVKDSKPTAPSGSEDQRLRFNDFKLQHSLPNALGCRGEVTRQLQASEPLDPEAFGAFNTACLQPSVLLVRFRHSGFRTASEQLQNGFRTASEQLNTTCHQPSKSRTASLPPRLGGSEVALQRLQRQVTRGTNRRGFGRDYLHRVPSSPRVWITSKRWTRAVFFLEDPANSFNSQLPQGWPQTWRAAPYPGFNLCKQWRLAAPTW